MWIKSLIINNLRNITEAEIQPHPKLNVFHGDNGAGKTSILEALILLAKGKSFRAGSMGSLIGPAADQARVVARIGEESGAEHRLGLERGAGGWRGRLDGRDVAQIGDLAQRMPFALLEPGSHLLVSGPPETRRKFLDWGVFHVEHRHLDNWRRYARAVRQRNAALRLAKRSLVASLDPQVAELGEMLARSRHSFVDEMEGVLARLLADLSPELPSLSLRYVQGWREGALLEALAASLNRDLERGATSCGPHRADLLLEVDGIAARERLSRGEQKVLAAGLVLAQAEIIRQGGSRPLLLLDDLASEFDAGHVERVIRSGMAMEAQTWVTGTSKAALAVGEPGEAFVFHVKHGQIGVPEEG